MDGCSCCGSQDARPCLASGGCTVVECSRCGLLRTESTGTGNSAPQARYATDQNYLAIYRKHYLKPRTVSFRRWLPRLEPFRTDGRLLEIGSGPGFFLAEANRADWQAVGLEVSAAEARHAREELGVEVAEGTVEEDLPAGPFDVVAAWDVLEHLEAPGDVLERIAGVLRPGGGLFLKVPDAAALTFRPAGWLEARLYNLYLHRAFPLNPREHLYHFTEPVLKDMLDRAGLELKTVDRTETLAEIPIVSDSFLKAFVKRRLFRRALSHTWPHVMHVIARKR